MLALQTEHENLFVPDLEVASLTPVHPRRTRVVLADGTVGYRPGPPPPGLWTPLEDSFVTPQLLVQEGNYWRDPADYRYPYQPLDDLQIEEEPTDLPEDLLTFERHGRKYFWRTDTGLQPCPYKADQALELYPQLCQVGRSHLINLQRVRRFGPRRQGGWVQLDNGERFDFGMRLYYGVAQALGCQSMAFINRDQPPLLLRLRDLPYDLTSADPERIRKDCPTAQSFLYCLLWQTVLSQAKDHGHDMSSYLEHPLQAAARRCGYHFTHKQLSKAISHLVHEEGLIQLRQLGWSEAHPSRRRVGHTRPQVLLVACHIEAHAAAQKWGTSLLFSQPTGDRLCLEYLVAELPSPLQLLFYRVEDKQKQAILLGLQHLDVDYLEPVKNLENLDQLEISLPQPEQPPALEPFRRIALQAGRGVLCMVEPHEIAAWSPSRYSRWRVVLADGQVMHHPGPVPAGPWVAVGEHWLQPALLSDGRDPAGFLLTDQPLPAAPTSAPLPSPPGLVQLTRTQWIPLHRIRTTKERSLELDDGQQFPVAPSRHTHHLKQLLDIPAFDQLCADSHGLQLMGLRDFPFEIARAPQALLRQHFPTPHLLLFNILYQSYETYQKTGIVPYGNTLSGYFYRPLQAALYRAGFLTRAQWRAIRQRQKPSPKDRHYMLFLRLLHDMVYRHRLFRYREFGFKDPYPEDRLIGNLRPQLVLLVEKGDQVEEFGRRLQAEFGVTLHILQGMPSLMATEFFAQELKSRGQLQVQIFFYGDFDCGGWDIGPAMINQLRFCGIECTRLERLVLPECFTAQELQLLSRPIHVVNAKWESRVRRWLKQSGGINGQARGIHANFLTPYDRVQSRMEQLLA